MTHKEAYIMKEAINLLISGTNKERYCVAVEERFPATDNTDADYEVHLFLRDPKKSGLINLTLLAHAIEMMGTHYFVVESTYDAGTEKGKDIRDSIKIW